MKGFSPREHAPSILVASLSALFGVALLQVTSVLAVIISDGTAGSATVAIMLSLVAMVFIAISTYVGSVVTANTFSTIIAGRRRTIALLRLVGSSARSLRSSVAREGFVVGVIGAALGLVLGTALAAALVAVGTLIGAIPTLDYGFVNPVVLVPVAAVVLTTWLASWIGARRVLQVAPIEATGAAVESRQEEVGARRGRNVTSIVLIAIGAGLLASAVLLGLITPAAVLVGVLGGIVSFTGVVLAAPIMMPAALRLVGRLLGRSSEARMAAENAVRYPERSARTTIGLVIGVTLVTMFIVAVATFQSMLEPVSEAADLDELMAAIVGVFSVLIGFSALIAAVGMVNNLSLSVLQRTRELGLLRALGFTVRQLRAMIRIEAAQLTATALAVGLLLGTVYGWVGAQSLLGSMPGAGLVLPVVPWWLLAVIAAVGAVLTVAASVAPTRRATSIAPVVALAVE
ncbi:putative ABC transport system permease protein [Microbacteriaceae bacterium SG_E_30_P1]|uniref:ABC transport system permease protein n=1 Tax=Antiquaquibacter oligotrophicus TaxID=2880260 RepID=A0ABT6KPW7_9MICO|nr:ABC transporter permease [Antiquaquibacter oligotrophicus]MDH6181137.1 putative ABC transport system permease protein [Antiquaquibacter oligotrophicus]UDF13166.1 ABC transporter permease [Antiquaquibacter oligotrophicus]